MQGQKNSGAIPDLPDSPQGVNVVLSAHSPKQDVREVANTLTHELQHSNDFFGREHLFPKEPTHSVASKRESRAMLRSVLAEKKLFGMDPIRVAKLKEEVKPYIKIPAYQKGAVKVLRLLKRISRG